jgi:peptidoglycan/xylan/chitin deacetylase (PgdA/CDA1 family)
MRSRLPILTYHSLDTSGSPVSVSPSIFRRHLAALYARGYAVLPLSEAFQRARRGEQHIAALTFDDGYASVREHALPSLARYGWRATVFAVSEYVGGFNDWPSQPSWVPPATLMGWDALRELAALGWEIGAHTRTHADLTRLSHEELEAEVVGGKLRLERQLGLSVRSFAYPYGRYDARVQAITRGAFHLACGAKMAASSHRSDPHTLERLEMWYFGHPLTARLLTSRWTDYFALACRLGHTARARFPRRSA